MKEAKISFTYKGPQEDEKKSCWNINFCEISENCCFLQSNERRQRLLQKVDFSNQNVRSFSTLWDLLHEVAVDLVVAHVVIRGVAGQVGISGRGVFVCAA